MSAEDEERRQRLAATAALLTAEISKMNNQLRDTSVRVSQLAARNQLLDQRAKRHSIWIWATGAGLVLSLVACAVLGFVVAYNRETGQQLKATNVRLEATIVRLERAVQGQCDFNALLLGSYRPESRPPGPERDRYEAGFVRMREIYEFVGCVTAPLPPAMPR